MSAGKKRVAVLMSGGVDSSVAAALLRREGHEVIGVTLQLWDYDSVAVRPGGQRGCCDISHQMDARYVCRQLGIPHVVLDLREAFLRDVVEPYERTYLEGETPNPCVLCNSRIKWGSVIAKADALECDLIATGHYARIESGNGRPLLLKGRDPAKDQSYALWQVPLEALRRTLLPNGDYTKREVRRLAGQLDLRTARKAESQEVCFIPARYDDYLREKYPGEVDTLGEGAIVDGEGRELGRHTGFFSFTIGQRKGLNIRDGRGPYYVTELRPETNQVVVGRGEELKRPGLLARGVNWVSLDPPEEPRPCRVKIRYNDPGVPAVIDPPAPDGSVAVRFESPQRAVTPGQSAVWYHGDTVWGGGIISRALKG